MPDLIITRGLPGSGKTTRARAWVAEDRATRARVNRDDLRRMVDDGQFQQGVTETRIVAARNASIFALLRSGVDVINDDTNLPQRTARDLARLARQAGAGFRALDCTHVPLETCLARNAARTDKKPVPEEVIRKMHARFLHGRPSPLPLPVLNDRDPGELVPYAPVPGTPQAVLVDVDGTVALKGGRSPYDETRVSEDLPNLPVITVVRAMAAAGTRVIFMSGRTDACRDATWKWLCNHVAVPIEALFMRAAGDTRNDVLVKRELFDQWVRYNYTVTCVIDDRRQVVGMWRAIDLTVLQCAEGDF